MSAAVHRVLAHAHRCLADTLETWPELTETVTRSSVEARPIGGEVLLRAEIRLRARPAVDLLEEPRRCAWEPEMLEAPLITQTVVLWPAPPPELGARMAAEAGAHRVLRRARRELEQQGDLSDETLDWLADAADRLRPGDTLDLIEALALAAVRPGGVGAELLARLGLQTKAAA